MMVGIAVGRVGDILAVGLMVGMMVGIAVGRVEDILGIAVGLVGARLGIGVGTFVQPVLLTYVGMYVGKDRKG